MLIKILRILERHASRTQQFAWQFYGNTIFGVNNVSISSRFSDSHRAIALSTIHQPPLSPSPCNWFFVFRALCRPRNPNFSFFTLSLLRTSVIRTKQAVLRYPRNLAITFRLISRLVTEGHTQNGNRLWYLCKQVGAMRTVTVFICFPVFRSDSVLFSTYLK